MPKIKAIRGSTGDWLLRLVSDDIQRLLACMEVIVSEMPRARLELVHTSDRAECAIELVSHDRAKTLIDALQSFYQRRKGHITYSLGNVTAGTVDKGVLVDR